MECAALSGSDSRHSGDRTMVRRSNPTANLVMALAVATGVAAGCSAEPAENRRSGPINGQRSSLYPAVGHMLYRNDAQSIVPDPACSATLVRRDVALTAASCVTERPNDRFSVGSGPIHEVATTVVHPEFDPSAQPPRHNLALVF